MFFYSNPSKCSLIKAVWFLIAAFNSLWVSGFFIKHICLKIPQKEIAHGQVRWERRARKITKRCDHLLREQSSGTAIEAQPLRSSPVVLEAYKTHVDFSSFSFWYIKVSNHIHILIRVHSQINYIFFQEKVPKITYLPGHTRGIPKGWGGGLGGALRSPIIWLSFSWELRAWKIRVEKFESWVKCINFKLAI